MDLQNEFIVPDGTGWVLAARAWMTGRKDGLLRSLVVSDAWQPGDVHEAKCLAAYLDAARVGGSCDPVLVGPQFAPMPCAEAPGEFCKCGIWGLKSPAAFTDKTNPKWLFTDCVYGLVQLSGRISEGTLGYRAQLGRVAGIVGTPGGWVTPGFDRSAFEQKSEWLAQTYNVPLWMHWPVEDGQISEKVVNDITRRTG